MPTLSVLCPTRDPGPRVRALLEPLRQIADEILIAADSTADPVDLAHYAEIADRVIRFDRGPRHSALAWLHAQCRGDWILLLAGDEVVSAELLAALPELVARRDAVQVAFTIRWLWPGSSHWLADAPWYPDFHTRLMRNDGTLRFRGAKHELALPASPSRYLDLPIWHLSLAVTDLAARREKARRGVLERPGLRAIGGGELNATIYLPEDRSPAPRTQRVPPQERRRIDDILHASRPRPAAIPDLPVAGRDVIEPLWGLRAIDNPSALRCEILLLDPLPIAAPNDVPRTLFVRVRNDGPEPWTWGEQGLPPVRLGWRWLIEDPPADGRAFLPCDVPIGDEVIIPCQVVVPSRPGRHTLEFDMVLEHVTWLNCATRVEVDVIDQRAE